MTHVTVQSYHYHLIYPFSKLQRECDHDNTIGILRESYSLASRSVIPKSLQLMGKDIAHDCCFQSLLSTAAVAMFVIFAVGAAGHLCASAIGFSSALYGGACVWNLGSLALRWWQTDDPQLRQAAITNCIQALMVSAIFTTVSVLAFTETSSVAVASGIGLAGLLTSGGLAHIIQKTLLSEISYLKELESKTSSSNYAFYYEFLLETLNALEHTDLQVDDIDERKQKCAALLLIVDRYTRYMGRSPYNDVITHLEHRLDKLVEGEEKTSVLQTLELARRLKTNDDYLSNLTENRPPLELD